MVKTSHNCSKHSAVSCIRSVQVLLHLDIHNVSIRIIWACKITIILIHWGNIPPSCLISPWHLHMLTWQIHCIKKLQTLPRWGPKRLGREARNKYSSSLQPVILHYNPQHALTPTGLVLVSAMGPSHPFVDPWLFPIPETLESGTCSAM